MLDARGNELQVGDVIIAEGISDFRGTHDAYGQVTLVFGNTRGTIMVRLFDFYEAAVGMDSGSVRLHSTAYRGLPYSYVRDMFSQGRQ